MRPPSVATAPSRREHRPAARSAAGRDGLGERRRPAPRPRQRARAPSGCPRCAPRACAARRRRTAPRARRPSPLTPEGDLGVRCARLDRGVQVAELDPPGAGVADGQLVGDGRRRGLRLHGRERQQQLGAEGGVGAPDVADRRRAATRRRRRRTGTTALDRERRAGGRSGRRAAAPPRAACWAARTRGELVAARRPGAGRLRAPARRPRSLRPRPRLAARAGAAARTALGRADVDGRRRRRRRAQRLELGDTACQRRAPSPARPRSPARTLLLAAAAPLGGGVLGLLAGELGLQRDVLGLARARARLRALLQLGARGARAAASRLGRRGARLHGHRARLLGRAACASRASPRCSARIGARARASRPRAAAACAPPPARACGLARAAVACLGVRGLRRCASRLRLRALALALERPRAVCSAPARAPRRAGAGASRALGAARPLARSASAAGSSRLRARRSSRSRSSSASASSRCARRRSSSSCAAERRRCSCAQLHAQRVRRAGQLRDARVEVGGEALAQLVDRGAQLGDDLHDRGAGSSPPPAAPWSSSTCARSASSCGLGLAAGGALGRQAAASASTAAARRGRSPATVCSTAASWAANAVRSAAIRAASCGSTGAGGAAWRLRRVALELGAQRRDLRLARLELAAQRGQLDLRGPRAFQPLGDLGLDLRQQRRALLGRDQPHAQVVELAPRAGLASRRARLRLGRAAPARHARADRGDQLLLAAREVGRERVALRARGRELALHGRQAALQRGGPELGLAQQLAQLLLASSARRARRSARTTGSTTLSGSFTRADATRARGRSASTTRRCGGRRRPARRRWPRRPRRRSRGCASDAALRTLRRTTSLPTCQTTKPRSL